MDFELVTSFSGYFPGQVINKEKKKVKSIRFYKGTGTWTNSWDDQYPTLTIFHTLKLFLWPRKENHHASVRFWGKCHIPSVRYVTIYFPKYFQVSDYWGENGRVTGVNTGTLPDFPNNLTLRQIKGVNFSKLPCKMFCSYLLVFIAPGEIIDLLAFLKLISSYILVIWNNKIEVKTFLFW